MRDQTQLARLALDQIDDGILLVDTAGAVQHLNLAARRLLGNETAISRLEDLPAVETQDGDGEPQALSDHWSRLRRGDPLTGLRLRLPGAGGIRQLGAEARPLRDEQGTFAGALVWLRMEATAEERAADPRGLAPDAIFESMAEGVYVCDASGQVVMVNQAGGKLLGLSVEQALQVLSEEGEPINVRYPDGRPMPRHELPLQRTLRGKARAGAEMILRQAATGEEVILRVASSPILADDGSLIGAVAVATDITEMRRLERQREEFLSIAAHELKTPVTSIKLFAQGMQRTIERQGRLTPERAERDLRTIVHQIDRLSELVDDLLDVGRIRTGRLEYRFGPVDLVRLTRAVVQRFQAQIEAERRHTIQLLIEDAEDGAQASTTTHEPLPIEADGARLDQVLTNLLSNALKYSPTGGRISVRVARGDQPGWARLSVSDQGVGLTRDDLDLLFQPFGRARQTPINRNISGIGMGLYISHEIVARHGGRIHAESDGPGQGATFIIDLPAVPPAATRGS